MGDLILGVDKALVVPAGNGTDKPTVLDMSGIVKASARLIELQSVTRMKAGELLYTFISAWRDAKRYMAAVSRQLTRAKRRVKEVRAIVVLDKVPDELTRRGLASARSPAGSEDLRDSVVARDPEYQAASDIVEQLAAIVECLDIEAETFKMAYFSINKLIDPHERTNSSATSGGTGEDDVGAFTQDEKVEEFVNKHAAVNPKNYDNGFGAPKF